MKNVFLISCTKSKKPYICKAEDMYSPSAKFRASLKYADNRIDNRTQQIFILSAKYGLLQLDDVIETYDESLFDKSQLECNSWGNRVVDDLKNRFKTDETNFIILAGSTYINPLIGKLEHITTPLKGMPMAESIAWLQQHQMPEREEDLENNKLKKATSTVPKNKPIVNNIPHEGKDKFPGWYELLTLLKVGIEAQTINWRGETNLWFRAKSKGNTILIGPASENAPSSKAVPRPLTEREFVELSALYFPWREKQISRTEAANISQNSSYAFALMNHFAKKQEEAPKIPRMLVAAKLLRNADSLKAVPGDRPGWYRWWAHEEAIKLMLNSPYLENNFFDVVSPCLTRGKGDLWDYYCLYVGVAIKESIQSRLDWHVNQKHTNGNVRNGTLSTLRQTISSLLMADQSAQDETNRFIDMLKIEFQAIPLPLKSEDAKSHIESIENLELKKILYPLNIKDNEQEAIQEFRKQLSRLRYAAKTQALR